MRASDAIGRNLSRTNLGKGHWGVSVKDGLLINPSHALQISCVERVLAEQIPGRLGLNLFRMVLSFPLGSLTKPRKQSVKK